MFSACVRWAVNLQVICRRLHSYNTSSFEIAVSYLALCYNLTNLNPLPTLFKSPFRQQYESFWREERVANSQITAGSFQDHEKTTTVDSIGVRLDFFTGIPGKTSTKLLTFTDRVPKFIFDNAVKPDRRTTNTGNMILLRTATCPSEEDPH